MKGELHLRFTQADVWARGAPAAIAQLAPEPRPRLPASTCPFCACVWQRHSAGEPRADTLHARVVGRGPCAGAGGSWNPAFMGLREARLLGAPPPPWRPRSALCFWKSDSNVTGVALCDICPSGVPSCGFTYIVTNGRGLFCFF